MRLTGEEAQFAMRYWRWRIGDRPTEPEWVGPYQRGWRIKVWVGGLVVLTRREPANSA